MQRASHKGEHTPVDVSCLHPRDYFGLKIRDEPSGVRIAPIGAVP